MLPRSLRISSRPAIQRQWPHAAQHQQPRNCTVAQRSPSADDYMALMADVSDNIQAAQTAQTCDSAGAAAAAAAASSTAASGSETDKWAEQLAVNHTLSSLYLRTVKVQQVPQIDFAERRRKRELQEICEAAAKKGIKADEVEANLAKLQSFVPGLAPNLDHMKASDWATILGCVDRVVAVVITLKTHYPKVDISGVLQRTPKLLLKSQEQIQQDAQQVRAMLSRVADVDAIIEAVPYLMDPRQLAQSLANLGRWFPNQDPYDMLQKNPTMLVNIEEADLEADPLYGELTTAG